MPPSFIEEPKPKLPLSPWRVKPEEQEEESSSIVRTLCSEGLRDVVFGFSDGVTCSLALSAGLASVYPDNSFSVIIGCAAQAVAAMISMGLGAYLSAKTDKDTKKKDNHLQTQEVLSAPDSAFQRLFFSLVTEYDLPIEAVEPFARALRKNPTRLAEFLTRYDGAKILPSRRSAAAAAVSASAPEQPSETQHMRLSFSAPLSTLAPITPPPSPLSAASTSRLLTSTPVISPPSPTVLVDSSASNVAVSTSISNVTSTLPHLALHVLPSCSSSSSSASSDSVSISRSSSKLAEQPDSASSTRSCPIMPLARSPAASTLSSSPGQKASSPVVAEVSANAGCCDTDAPVIRGLIVGLSDFIGGLIPLLPYIIFYFNPFVGLILSISFTLCFMFCFGLLRGYMTSATGNWFDVVSSGISQVIVNASAAASAFAIARVLDTLLSD